MIFILYEKKFSYALTQIVEDIRRQDGHPKVKPVLVSFKDPYDFDECFRVMYDQIDRIRGEFTGQLLLSTNTGTHSMRFSIVLITEKGLFEGTRMVYLIPGKTHDIKANNTTDAEMTILSTSLEASPSYVRKLEEVREIEKNKLFIVTTNNDALKREFDLLNEVGTETSDPILLLGSTGTGKTTIASRLHQSWVRRHSKSISSCKLVKLNCGGYTGATAYSRLFGHVKGSFTDAKEDKEGALAEANQGTLFLDEIGNLELDAQAMLLSAIETGEYSRHGETQVHVSDFRLICATNINLHEAVSNGRFRHDLLARISLWPFTLPDLRDRREDIQENVLYELKEWNEKATKGGASEVRFKESALDIYMEFALHADTPWCDNFRDLIKSVNRMATISSLQAHRDIGMIDEKIVLAEIASLRTSWKELGFHQPGKGMGNIIQDIGCHDSEKPLAYEVERILLQLLYKRTGNKAEAARILYGDVSNPSAFYNSRLRIVMSRLD